MKAAMSWMAQNPVAANILLAMILIGGAMMAPRLPQEVFPEVALDMLNVTVVYQGAGPSEVANSLCVPLEEVIDPLEGIEELVCQANEGIAVVSITLEDGADPDERLQEVRNAVGTIQDFPADIETPQVSKLTRKRRIFNLALTSQSEPAQLFELARRVQDELSELPGVSSVDNEGLLNTELVIEVTPEALRSTGLSLTGLAAIIRQGSLDLPAGSIQTQGGEILVRTVSKRERPSEFAQLVVQSQREGSQTRLGEIARITERPAESQDYLLLDGKRAVFFNVYQKMGFTPAQVATQINEYLETTQAGFSPGVDLVIWQDRSEIFQQRFDLLVNNGIMGLVLVFIILALFLEIHLAFWVMLGIPISFAGSLLLMPFTGVSINMISLMAFILVLGIVVDDAIVVGESVFQKIEEGKSRLQAAIEGATEVGPAVFSAVITTLVAFAPLMFIDGAMGRFLVAVPVIVMSVLLLSLVESLFILPAHLSFGGKPFKSAPMRALERLRVACDDGLDRITHGPYKRFVEKTLKNSFATLAFGVVSLMLVVATVASGILPMQFFPKIEDDEVRLTATLPPGIPAAESRRILEEVVAKGAAILAKADQEQGKKESSLLNSYIRLRANSGSGSAEASVRLRLIDADQRSINAFKLGKLWRQSVGEVPEITSLSLSSRTMNFGDDISITLSHPNRQVLEQAIADTKAYLTSYSSVVDIDDSEKAGKSEIQYRLSEEARSLGVSPQEFANELRAAFKGVNITTLLRNDQTVEVYLRYPAEVRNNLSNLEQLYLRTNAGGEITLGQAAERSERIEPTGIRRENRRPVVLVTASIDSAQRNPDAITARIKTEWLPQLRSLHPGLTAKMEGANKERQKSMSSLLGGFLGAMLMIYALLAIFFRSYTEPMLVMIAIPFGLAGAALGHLILGHPLSFMSLFGLVGLTGVVVNDSLILIDAIKRHPNRQSDPIGSLVEASQSRVRPILMTTATTFFGLMPLLAETSRQAQFLIPMAISLGVGIVFATLITLILIPSLYWILTHWRPSFFASR
ncbi:MAG: efflux RND transporter permease subunit [bacterium]|nr:efflux RND transporter permease subunit [bacterium]